MFYIKKIIQSWSRYANSLPQGFQMNQCFWIQGQQICRPEHQVKDSKVADWTSQKVAWNTVCSKSLHLLTASKISCVNLLSPYDNTTEL